MPSTCQLDPPRIRARLAERGWSQERLAREVGVELRTVQRWMTGSNLRVAHAEAVARALDLGMRKACATLPASYGRSTLDRVRPALRWLGRNDESFLGILGHLTRYWESLVALLETHGQPLDGYVERIPTKGSGHRFGVLDLVLADPTGPATVVMGGQVGPRLRYRFGEVRIEEGEVRLFEYAFTRVMKGAVRDDGTVRVWFWIGADIEEIVLTSEAAFSLAGVDVSDAGRTIFDRRRGECRDAVAFRPPPMDLQLAGLPRWDDRVRPSPIEE